MSHAHVPPSSRRLAFSATVHCLTGCSIGEILGMVVGTGLKWGAARTIVVSVVLAFLFGYALTLRPLIRSGMRLGVAMGLAFAADTLSITVMEIVDNAVMLAIPGAMTAGPGSLLFWGSLTLALVIAGIVAYPVNYWLVRRGQGHALVHVHGAGDEHERR